LVPIGKTEYVDVLDSLAVITDHLSTIMAKDNEQGSTCELKPTSSDCVNTDDDGRLPPIETDVSVENNPGLRWMIAGRHE
jgi:hypothetical protein